MQSCNNFIGLESIPGSVMVHKDLICSITTPQKAVDPLAIKASPARPPITPRTMIASFRFLPEGVGICGGRPLFLTVNYSSRRVILCHRAWSFSQRSELRERIDKAVRNFRDRIPTESRRKPF
ncbi:hypothetical protein NPIL_350441 [Nephila pilipes]|uniref:Uncharacterized protein n=1 Tax=Nephila pilipes TaxID=299642 RepID=A0A8X6ICA1_NEPPI|nr:hypothetical protein NPIL_350441 [Nephila pilipes]